MKCNKLYENKCILCINQLSDVSLKDNKVNVNNLNCYKCMKTLTKFDFDYNSILDCDNSDDNSSFKIICGHLSCSNCLQNLIKLEKNL